MNSPFTEEQVELLNRLLPQLTEPQKQWLGGYLAATGQVTANSGVPELALGAPASAPVVKEVTLLYGTQTGNCQELAEGFSAQLEANHYDVKLLSMSDFKPRDTKKLSNLLIVISTHGEGDPPDTALPFHEFLHGSRAPDLKELNYSVLALGDSSYEYYCETGKEFDLALDKLGAARLTDRVDCDLDFDEPAGTWFEQTLAALEEATGATAAPSQIEGVFEEVVSTYSRTNPYYAEVLENIDLSGRGSNKENRHIELLIEDTGIQFQPGDSLGIYPENDPKLVEELIAEFGWDEDMIVATGKDGEASLKEALTNYFEITVLTKPLLQKLSGISGNEEIKLLVEAEDSQDIRDYIYGRDLLDIIREHEVQNITADNLTGILRKMPGRLYSIASSYQANPDEVHLLIGAVRYDSYDRERSGVCSVQVAERIAIGDKLPIYVQKNENFRLPEEVETPIIMVGPGTGIAPFRSFMEERDELGVSGDSWLFFGDQHYVTDFLYQVEWQNWVEDGVLSRLDVAFSRDADEKVYVQHKMAEHATELYKWLERGAVVYICGDEECMAKDVHETLLQIIETEGGHAREAAEEYLANMQQNKRYQRDVY